MHVVEEAISILWPWVELCEPEPQEYVELDVHEVQSLQLDLMRVCEMLQLTVEPTQES